MTKKSHKIKSLIDRKSMKAHVEFLNKSGFAYQLKISNYTTEIISELYHIQFVSKMRGKQMFAAYSKIKKDVRTKEIPVVKRSDLKYFHHDIMSDCYYPHVINIDLNSAYPTVLFNNGYITRDTFHYIQRIPKTDRLASIGMLASKKYCFDYATNGNIYNFQKLVSPYENFFFFCVKVIQEIMTDLKHICNTDYIFTWVDGIYFKVNDELLPLIAEYLHGKGFSWTVDILDEFKVNIIRGKIKVDFIKDGVRKYFNIPSRENIFALDIVNYLTYQNLDYEGNISSKITRRKGN